MMTIDRSQKAMLRQYKGYRIWLYKSGSCLICLRGHEIGVAKSIEDAKRMIDEDQKERHPL